MMHWIAIPAFAASTTRTVLEFSRLQEMTEWWQGIVIAGCCAAILSYVIWLYRRDTRELPRGVRWGLVALRLTAFLGLLVFFLDLERRSERELTRHSRVAVLVDTSQSMGLADPSSGTTDTRLQQVIQQFGEGPLLSSLQEKHDVVVYRFDQATNPVQVAAFRKTSAAQPDSDPQTLGSRRAEIAELRTIWAVALGIAGAALFALVLHALLGGRVRGREGEAYLVLAGTVGLIAALVVAGVGSLRHPTVTVAEVLSGNPVESPQGSADRALADGSLSPDGVSATEDGRTPFEASPAEVAWDRELVARGTETRLGEAIRWVLDNERDGPLAGIVLVTDGQHNAGISPEALIKAAQTAEVPVYPVGMGSERQPRSVRLVDLEAPARVYPGDRFTIAGYLQANGLSGRTVDVTLTQRTMEDAPTDPPVAYDRRVTLQDDGQISALQFEVVPDKVGRTKWVMEVKTSENDDLDTRDNIKQSTVQVVERKSRVLLIAGGPNRDYRFLRNQLYRDKNTQLDVLLQTAPPGAAQEANEVLLEFPQDRDAMFQYDCVVAFDPDWTQFAENQIQLLDEWVAEQAGGLIVVAGPVHTGSWSRGASGGNDEKLRLIRDLYPVTFYRRGAATITLGRVGSETAWPLEFSDEGRRAQFLWLDESPTQSEQMWQQFTGVYGYQATRDVKPGAQVYARFSDPQAASGSDLPVYMAGHFYGAGRVFYQGSGEMWRLNQLDPAYFTTYYTQLIRHVSQGRLLRDSNRGLLLVDNEQTSLGDTITVRAALSDAQYQPLTVETVPANLLRPDGTSQALTLRRLETAERPGMYSAQFTTTQDGTYRVELPIPSVESEVLTREIRVRVPAREIESPQRNDALLSDLAKQTSGAYYVGLPAAVGQQGVTALPNQVRAKDQVTFLPGTPDRSFEQKLMSWLMALIAGALCLEWLIRRLYKLA